MTEQQRSLREELVEDGMMSVKEAVEFTGLSQSTLYSLMNRRKLPYSKMGLGSRRLIPRRALKRLMADTMFIDEAEWASAIDQVAN